MDSDNQVSTVNITHTTMLGGCNTLPLAQRERHKSLWFSDGTIILATRTTLFRVYRGILAQSSPVFHDLFSLPQPIRESDHEAMDGVPVVEVHDDPDELAHLLSTLHDHSYYNHKEPTDFSVVAALLRLSSKYQIHVLRKKALFQLSTLYPDTLDDYDITRIGRRALVYADNDASVDVAILSLARETSAMQLLPLAFYHIAAERIHWMGMDPSTSYKRDEEEIICYNALSKEDLMTVVTGREQLRRALVKEIGRFLYDASPDTCSGKKCSSIKAKRGVCGRTWSLYLDRPLAFDPRLPATIAESVIGLCVPCHQELKTSMVKGRRIVWERLPMYFGLSDWETLREISARSSGTS